MSSVHLDCASAHWDAGRDDEALAEAWQAYREAPGEYASRRMLLTILRDRSAPPGPDSGEDLRALARDPDIDPGGVSPAGWLHLLKETDLFGATDEALARRLEANELALALLEEDPVCNRAAEAALSGVRRRLLEGGQWRAFPRLTAALIAQAALNGGAWPFEESERALLVASGEFTAAYLPPRESASQAGYDNAVTRAVADQYEGWPYPQWKRITKPKPTTLAERVRRYDPDGPQAAGDGAQILIAGCGTGRQVAASAWRHPTARITAIDLSQASLRYAARRCAEAGVHGIDYRLLDLHDAATLGRKFDAVFCTGVLHHLPDPEAGWAALAGVLKPGGVMHVMVYSKIARMRIAAWRKSLADLMDLPMSDDLLRAARRRILDNNKTLTIMSRDFYSLAGAHDLLMHRHEDPFDVPRIRRALDGIGLRLIRFQIPRRAAEAEYRAAHPDDPLQRDFDGWRGIERAHPAMYAAMYDLWCRKPL